MAFLRNHKSFWMRDDAEASLARWEDDNGIIPVNSAGRYEWEQQALINRWNQGGKYNRPPYLYEPKRPAKASAHVANGGRAFDTSEYTRFLKTCIPYGWRRTYDWDVVHFEYFPEYDMYKNRPTGGGAAVPTTPSTNEEDDDMSKNVGVYYAKSTPANTWVYMQFNTTSGYYSEYGNGDGAGQAGGDYNSPYANTLGTGSWAKITESHANAIKRSLDLVRQGK